MPLILESVHNCQIVAIDHMLCKWISAGGLPDWDIGSSCWNFSAGMVSSPAEILAQFSCCDWTTSIVTSSSATWGRLLSVCNDADRRQNCGPCGHGRGLEPVQCSLEKSGVFVIYTKEPRRGVKDAQGKGAHYHPQLHGIKWFETKSSSQHCISTLSCYVRWDLNGFV